MSTGKAAVRRPRMTRKWRAKVLASGLSDVLPVECGEMHARLHLFKIGSGTRGTSIEWEGNWLTPVQFEQISGMERAHNWKQSIRYENRSLNCYIKLGLIKLHHRYCDCDRCITPLLELDKSRTSKRGKYEWNGDDHGTRRDWRYDVDDNDSFLGFSKRRKRRETSFVEARTVTPTSCTLTDNTDSGYSLTRFTCNNTTVPVGGEQDGKTTQSGLKRNAPSERYVNAGGRYSSHSMESTRRREFFGISPPRLLQHDFQRLSEFSARPPFITNAVDNKIQKRGTLTESQANMKPLASTSHSLTDSDVRRDLTVHQRLAKVLRKAGLTDTHVLSWSVDDVVSFVDAAGFSCQSSVFRQHVVSGETLMRMRERHLIDRLKLKLGPSLRLFALVRGLQQTVNTTSRFD